MIERVVWRKERKEERNVREMEMEMDKKKRRKRWCMFLKCLAKLRVSHAVIHAGTFFYLS